eukprot:scaffold1828_cov258-Pinguiococcus_pyrenoidosus.AAC.11
MRAATTTASRTSGSIFLQPTASPAPAPPLIRLLWACPVALGRQNRLVAAQHALTYNNHEENS